MKIKIVFSFWLFALMGIPVVSFAQNFSDLQKGEGVNVTTYYSKGHSERSSAISDLVEEAYVYFQKQLLFSPEVTLLVLSKEDWGSYTTFPVYGMPHYNDDKTLIVAAEDNAFWNSFIPEMDTIPDMLAIQIINVYGGGDTGLSMRPFFDLLAIHELGHAFHMQAEVSFQRSWMSEWWVNIMLHHFIADRKPELLPGLTLFPEMVIRKGSHGLLFTSLRDVHDKYNEIGRDHPQNYGWYQCHWHASAAELHDIVGNTLGAKIWSAFKVQSEKLSEEALLVFIKEKVDPIFYTYVANWDQRVLTR